MTAMGGTKSWLVAASVALVLSVSIGAAFVGTASASPAPAVATSSPDPWAYGGVGYSNTTIISGSDVLSWNAEFGWTAVFTVTPTGATTFEVEEQRVVGVTLNSTLSTPKLDVTYQFHAQEIDTAFANLTNASSVYVDGSAVPALGLENDATFASAALAESLAVTRAGVTKTASLDVNGNAQTAATFTPALGIVPLNLSGVHEWNSTATIDPHGAWNITWSWSDQGILGITGSGTGSSNGTAGVPGTVNLTGYDVTAQDGIPAFVDHKPRQAIVLVVEGPLGNYDLFVLVPHDFDFFGGAAQAYDADALGSATISAQTLYVSTGVGGPQVTAASTTFGANDAGVASLQTGVTLVQPGASSSPGPTVVGSPLSVAAAQAESKCLTTGCSAGSSLFGETTLLVLIGAAVAVVVGTVGVIEWRSYARRRGTNGSVGGYAEAWQHGAPPSTPGAMPPTPPGQAPGGPLPPSQPPRQG